jgi:hypothetical protein
MPIIRSLSTAAINSAVGQNRTDHDQQHCYHHVSYGKTEAAAAAVDRLLMMNVRMPETC